MNAPKLRFKEFNEEWLNQKLYEVAKVYDGTHQTPKYQKDGIKFLSVENIKNLETNKYISQEDFDREFKIRPEYKDILMTRIGDIGTANIIRDDDMYAYYVSLALIKPYKIDPEYLLYFIESGNFQKELYKRTLHVAFPKKINKGEIGECYISFPINKIEQIKIGSFFKRLKAKVQLQQEKIDSLKEQKKGYMQKILSQEFRFKDEHGYDFPDWKKNIKADELFESVSNKNHNGDYPVLSATQNNGMVYRDSLERHMSFNNDNLKSYKLVEEEDFIISLRSFQGGIEFSSIQGLVSPAYTVFRKKNDSVYNSYFAKVFKTDNFITRLNSTTYGIRDGKAISYKDFSTLKFDIPSLEEQKKIARFLDLQDKKISIEEKKLEELQNQKQAFMQQMFI